MEQFTTLLPATLVEASRSVSFNKPHQRTKRFYALAIFMLCDAIATFNELCAKMKTREKKKLKKKTVLFTLHLVSSKV